MIVSTPSAKHLKLGQARVVFSEFNDGERYVKVVDKQKKPIVIAGLYQPDRNIIDLLLVLNALEKVHHLIITYFGYARQDKPLPGEPNSVQVLANLIKTCKKQATTEECPILESLEVSKGNL